MSERCCYVKEDGTCLGLPCEEAAEWRFNNQAEDDSDYEEFVVCSKHLTDMMEHDVEYLVRSLGDQ